MQSRETSANWKTVNFVLFLVRGPCERQGHPSRDGSPLLLSNRGVSGQDRHLATFVQPLLRWATVYD